MSAIARDRACDQRMNPNSDEFQQFLREMGVEMDEEAEREAAPQSEQVPEPRPEPFQEEPTVTMLQQSRDYQVFYQLNLIQGIPQLRVVLPVKQGSLKFQIFLVQLSEQHPLVSLFPSLSHYRGSQEFERERERSEWHLLFAIGEMMKDLFWAGAENAQFPLEITVQRLI